MIKKYKKFILSMLITIVFLSIIFLLIIKISQPKETYSLSGHITTKTISNKVISGSSIDYKDCQNSNGDFSINLELGCSEKRPVKFEVSVLVNYEQQTMEIQNKKLQSIILEVNGSSKSININVSESAFECRNNIFIINIRQDIDKKVFHSDMFLESNTINLRYNVDGKKENTLEKKVNNQTQNRTINRKYNHLQHNIFDLAEDKYVVEYKNKKIKTYLDIASCRNGLILAFVDSKQVLLNGKPYLYFPNEASDIAVELEIMIPDEIGKGKYEIEFYYFPNPISEVTENSENVINSNRHLLEVR